MAKRTVKCSEVWPDCIYACQGYSNHDRKPVKVFVSCDYILKKCERRGCNPEKCDKFKSLKEKKAR